MTDLFQVPDSPSPKLTWLRKHKLGTKSVGCQWLCHDAGYVWTAYGESEEDSILAYCEKYDLTHWTLE